MVRPRPRHPLHGRTARQGQKGADRNTIYAHAARISKWAAREIRKNPRCRADVALAAANVVNSAADSTENQQLRQVAERFMQDARTGRLRGGCQSPAGQALWFSARLLMATAPPGKRGREATRQLVTALIGLAHAVGQLKQATRQLDRTVASRRAARIRATGPRRERR